jgi:intracellular septation protein A
MHPENMLPFFPVEDTLWVNFQVFGDLPEGDDEGLS